MSPRAVPRLASTGSIAPRVAIVLALGVVSIASAIGSSVTDPQPAYRGRPLAEVLLELRERGLNLIFSSSVVREDLSVTVDPESTDPRAILDEILAPLGLRAREGPGRSILIVPARSAPGGERIRGRVLSAARGTPIVRASVRVVGTTAHTTTRPDGTFELPRMPAGSYELVVDAPGFSPATLRHVRVPPPAPVELTVTLQGYPAYVEEIVVTPSKLSILWQEQASALTVSNLDAVLVPSTGGDVSRVIESLPGVAAADNSAAFNVRGSQARDVALVLDGLELYEPFHMQNFQSPFGLIDSGIVDSIDFYAGGLTADFGDRHGGLVKMSTAAPRDPHRTRIQVGSLNSRFAHGAPTSGGSWLISTRAWYPEVWRDTIELGEDGLDPRFGDAYVKVSFNVSPRMVVSAHGLGAYDRLDFEEAGGGESVQYENTSSYLWLRTLRSWSPKVYSETVLSAGRLRRSLEGISEPEDEPVGVTDDRTVETAGLRQDSTWELSNSHLLRAGLEVRRLEARYRYSREARDSTTSTPLDPAGTSLGLYLAHRASLSAEFATELGLRWDRQTYTDDNQLSPRLNAVWRHGDRSEVRLGLGWFYQSQRIHELRIQDGETGFLPAELSRQAELTYQQALPGGVRLRLDAYDRRLSRLHPRYENLANPIELFPETEADRVLVAPTRARLRGAELLLRGDPKRSVHWWVSYARSAAEDVTDGREAPRSWDQTHAVKGLVGYRPSERWLLSLSGAAHTGWPTTPVTAELTTLPDGSTEITEVPGPRNSKRFPDYARLDLKASRVFSVARGRLRLNVEILNLTDRDNVCCVDEFLFEPRGDGTVDVVRELDYWLGITPSFSVSWEF
jgi:hypothetical protein